MVCILLVCVECFFILSFFLLLIPSCRVSFSYFVFSFSYIHSYSLSGTVVLYLWKIASDNWRSSLFHSFRSFERLFFWVVFIFSHRNIVHQFTAANIHSPKPITCVLVFCVLVIVGFFPMICPSATSSDFVFPMRISTRWSKAKEIKRNEAMEWSKEEKKTMSEM